MSTTAMANPVGFAMPEASVVEHADTVVVDAIVADAVAAQPSWVSRLISNVKNAVVRGWRAFRRGLGWLKNKIFGGAEWVGDKVTRGATWLRDHAGDGIAWSRDKVKRGWAWSKETVVGAWSLTAPFRTWVSTPLRMAITGTGGIAAAAVLGGQAVIALSVIWVAYLLIAGRKQPDPVVVTAKADAPALNDAQKLRVSGKVKEVVAKAEDADQRNDKNMKSEFEGWRVLLQARLVGNGNSPTAIGRAFKADMEEAITVESFRKTYTMSAFQRGADAAEKWFKAVLKDKTTDVVAVGA